MKYFILGLMLLGCGSKEPKQQPVVYSPKNPEVNTTNPKSPSIMARELAAELGSNFVTEIPFKKDSTHLSKVDRKKLANLHREARQQSKKIKSVKILSWGDREYPTQTAQQEELAKKRGQTVRRFLKNLDQDMTFDEINMALKTQKLTPLIDKEEARIKRSLEIHDFHQERASLVIVIYLLENI